jgi:ABC-type molybdate transport system substrate-binding protein
VPIPREQNLLSRVAIGVLKFSENPPLARQFVQFLTSPEGRRIFAKHHYTIHPPK